ncbi:MAG: NUDIX domain-containing protein [Cyanobacteria bacterium TGS_CYA1]|nr:NUDIX domain-containing protein [Cyanobacteria bacterium TGS_CYA1]
MGFLFRFDLSPSRERGVCSGTKKRPIYESYKKENSTKCETIANWIILPNEGESLEDAARRETFEETGIEVKQSLVSLGHIEYTKSRKRVHCFAAEAITAQIPATLSWEIDKAEFITLDEARKCIHPDQAAFLDRLPR